MPVFAVKASRTFWKFACSAPPHREVTVIEPLVAPEPPGAVLSVPVLPAGADAALLPPGAVVAPPLHAPRISIAAIGNVIRRGNLAIWPPPCRRWRRLDRPQYPDLRPGESSKRCPRSGD